MLGRYNTGSCSLNAIIRIYNWVYQIPNPIYFTTLYHQLDISLILFYLIFTVSCKEIIIYNLCRKLYHLSRRNPVSSIRNGKAFFKIKGTKPIILYIQSITVYLLIQLWKYYQSHFIWGNRGPEEVNNLTKFWLLARAVYIELIYIYWSLLIFPYLILPSSRLAISAWPCQAGFLWADRRSIGRNDSHSSLEVIWEIQG